MNGDNENPLYVCSKEVIRRYKPYLDKLDLYILLAGGEPLLRRDIIEAAGKMQNIIFPIFTNGTYIDEKYLKLFDKCRNLIPVMSIEGGKEETDMRRKEWIRNP